MHTHTHRYLSRTRELVNLRLTSGRGRSGPVITVQGSGLGGFLGTEHKVHSWQKGTNIQHTGVNPSRSTILFYIVIVKVHTQPYWLGPE